MDLHTPCAGPQNSLGDDVKVRGFQSNRLTFHLSLLTKESALQTIRQDANSPH